MKSILLFLLILTPLIGNAASIPPPADFKGLVGIFTGIIAILIPFIFTLAFITFVWGITKAWIIKGGDADSIDSGKKIAVVGLIVFVIMFGIWGILTILRNSFFGV